MSQNPIIKKGYKQTEIGVIPEDWEVVPLDEISDKRKQWSITGGPFGSNLKASDYTNTGVQIIQLQNIGDGYFDNASQVYTSKEKADELKSCNIYPGEIIISKMGDPVARACLIPSFQKRFVMSSDGIRLLINRDENAELYILNYINSPYFRNRAFAVSTGSTRLRIGLPELKGLLVVKPSKDEQSAIASILSDIDALIANLDRLIKKKKAIKQGTMQELLTGKRRLQGFNGEWTGKKIGDIFILSASYSKTEFIEKDGRYLIMDMGSVSQEGKNISSKRTSLKSDCLVIGDLVMPKDDIGGGNIIGKTVYIEKNDKYILGDHVYKLSSKNININPIFFSYLINSNKINRELRKKVAGSAQLGLGRKSVENQELKFPFNKGEQDAIAKIIIDLDSEIESLEYQRTKYKTIKQGMMQQLLTGNIRVYGHN